jgi:tetratricopeptide (TPR) repeat protein
VRSGERLFQGSCFDAALPATGWAVVRERPQSVKLQLQGLPVFLEVEARYLQPDQTDKSLQVLSHESVESFIQGLGHAGIAEEGPAVVGGRPGWRVQLTGKSSGLPVQAMELTARDGDRLLVIDLAGAEHLLGRGLVAWMRAADTLTPHPASNDTPPATATATELEAAAEHAMTVERDPSKAAALFARALALVNPAHDAAVRQKLLEADLAAGQRGRAIGALRAELVASPNRFDRWELLGALLLQGGDGADAVKTLQEASHRPGCPGEVFRSLGGLLLAQQQLPDAQVAFLEAVRLSPSDASAYAGLGEVYLKEHDFERAEKAESRAAQLDPGEGEIHAVLSEVYGEMKRYPEALTESMAALQRDIPKRLGATLRYNVACYYARLGHARDCIWWLRQALEAGFDDLELMKTDPDLASVRDSEAFKELLTP